MADLDAELLALAGGDSSDDEAGNQIATQPAGPASPGSSGGDDGAARIATTPKKTKRGGARKPKRDDSEEGEASPPSENDSIPMDESEDDALPQGGASAEAMFPIGDRFYSDQDKKDIMSLPEVEREAVLAERAQMFERKKQDIALRQMHAQKLQQDSKKRKAPDTEEGDRKSARQRKTLGGRVVGEKSSQLEAYKAQREKKGQRKAPTADDGTQRRRDSGSSDMDAEGESEVEWDSARPQATIETQHDEPGELSDFNRLHIGRLQFAQYCFYPTFDNAVKNCYVRIALGSDRPGAEPTYRMAKIEGIKELEKPYAVDMPNGKKVVTTKYVVASVGKAKREWPFIFCSSQRFNEREFTRYKGMVTNDGLRLPSKSILVAKIKDINNMINYQFTELELQEKLKRQGVLDQKQNNVERSLLNVQKLEAERRGDREAARVISEKIAALSGPELAFGTSLHRPAPVKIGKTEQERLAELNRANRKKNTEDVRRAQLAEQKAAAALRAAVERGEAVADPFARVKIRPKTHFDANAMHVTPSNPALEATANEAADKKAADEAAPSGKNGAAPKKAVSEKLERMLRGEEPVEPGKLDFKQYDIMYQFGKLSRKKPKGRESIFKRKLFLQERAQLIPMECTIGPDFFDED